MRQATRHRPIEGSCVYRQSGGALGSATLRASNLLAVVCLMLGIASAAFVPVSVEQRIGSLFLFGLIPAIGFYAGGHFLSRMLVVTSQLCEMIAARCFRCFALLGNNFVMGVGPISDASITAIFEFSCLLIRSAARFVLRMQALCEMIAARCFRCFASLDNNFVMWVGRISDASIRAIFEFSCLLIRSAARFVLRMQASGRFRRV